MVSRQLNLRFDDRYHDLIRRVVERLRVDSGFAGALEQALAVPSAPLTDDQTAGIVARLDDHERRLSALETARPERPARRPSPSSKPAISEPQPEGTLVIWQGGRKRLTDEGREVVVRLIGEGKGDRTIGGIVGLSGTAISKIRKSMK